MRNTSFLSRFPVYIFHDQEYDYYGLPIHGNSGSKIGVDAGGPSVNPNSRSFVPDPLRLRLCTEFCQKYIPRVRLNTKKH